MFIHHEESAVECRYFAVSTTFIALKTSIRGKEMRCSLFIVFFLRYNTFTWWVLCFTNLHKRTATSVWLSAMPCGHNSANNWVARPTVCRVVVGNSRSQQQRQTANESIAYDYLCICVCTYVCVMKKKRCLIVMR